MKRTLSILLALLAALSFFTLGSAPTAEAKTEKLTLSDLAELDADTKLTLEQVLPLLQEAYALGYEDGQKAVGGSTVSRSLPGTADEGEISYVLNTNSHKFHYPDCSSVSDMNPKNRQDFSGTRDEVIAMGYQPCKRCKP